MWGMPEGFAGLIARKYQIMQQQADSGKTAADASANLDLVRAGLMPSESKAQIGLVGAQAGLANANARNTDESTKYIGDLARSNIALQGAQAYGARTGGQLNLANVGNVNADTFKTQSLTKMLGGLGPMGLGYGLPSISDTRRRMLGEYGM